MIYLDSAATSFLKPSSVAKAMTDALASCASPGRGVHAPAMRAAETVYRCRRNAADLFHMRSPENVVFTMNATHGLNIAVCSLVKKGMRVVTSGYEHNAVIRPLHHIGANIESVHASVFDPDSIKDEFRRRVPGADAVVCTHVSNVFGFILPIYEIAEICRKNSVPLIIDAAQSAGMLDLDFPLTGAAFAAMPGHKGLLGPQGTGLLLCADSGVPLMQGGTGSMSLSPDMPPDLPDRLEAGTLNVCGIAGLDAGISYIKKQGLRSVREKEERLTEQLIRGFAALEGLDIIVPDSPYRSGIVSVIPRDISCEELADRLGKNGVAVRAGLHCAPQAHATAGTLESGTVRFSVSPFNVPGEIRRTLEIMEKSLKNRNKL